MDRPKNIKDKAIGDYVDYLENKLSTFLKSPYVKTYITILNQIDSFNEQLTIQRIEKIIENQKVEVEYGRIDLFADKDEKSFDRGWKYLNECVDLNKKLDDLRKLMSVEEKKEIETLRDGSVAEKYIFNKK